MSLEPILFVPDTHRPYHDKRAWELMLNVAYALGPKHIIVGGDFVDCYTISAHSKDPRRTARLADEISDAKGGLKELKDTASRSPNLVYVAGNHEFRLQRYLESQAPELVEFVDIPSLLELEKTDWDFVPYREHYSLGKLYITHDTGTAGRDAHSRALSDFQDNVVINHTHRMGYEVRGNAKGVTHVSAMFGWLGDAKKADYMHQIKANRDWALGFGIGYLDVKTGCVYITPVPIVRNGRSYTCVVNGKKFGI